ncbi:MAG: hypothetical protein LQ339_000202 [Xanthoria mediterranea]|nr:MAG: hypothetical protein LQ339_000202 [Xanthoria mediterranea]
MSTFALEKDAHNNVSPVTFDLNSTPSEAPDMTHDATEKESGGGLLKPQTEPPSASHTPSAASNISDPALAEKAEGPQEIDNPPRDVHGIKWVLLVLSILSSTFLFALDNTIVADVQPAIVKRFGSIDKLPWLSVAFLVAAAGTNLVWGKIYARFDAKILYLITVFFFEAGSAICGAANTMDALIIGRAICGFGGAGMYLGVMTLLSVTTTEHERPTYIGLTGVTWGLGTVLGPIIGGAFTDSSAGWRWAFYINLVVGALFAPVWFLYLPRFDPRPGVALKKRLAEIDYVGTILIIGAYVSGVMAINFGGSTYPWESGRIIGLFVTSGVLFILFGTQQGMALLTTKDRRIFPVEFLKRRIMLILFAETACASTATFLPIYFIPLFFQFVRNDSALEAGVRLLPFVVFLVVVCVANGAIMSIQGYYFPWYVIGGAFNLIGAALMYTVNSDSSTARIYGYSILLAVGAGAFVQASFSVAQAKVKPHMIPLAIGFITAGQIGGVTISLAIANSVFLNKSTQGILAVLPGIPKEQVQAAISGAESAFLSSLDEATRRGVLVAIVDAMRNIYILNIVAGALALVLCLGMKPGEKLFMKGTGGAA